MIEIRTANYADMAEAFEVRRQVFIEEQGVPEALEFDALDEEARHLVAVERRRVLGTLRIRTLARHRTAKIERVAVLQSARGRGLGRLLMAAALERAAAAGASRVLLHAQVRVRRFYEDLGFIAEGPVFEEDGILHIAMTRGLEGAGDPERSA